MKTLASFCIMFVCAFSEMCAATDTISKDDSAVLHVFFKTLLQNTEGGYVLYDSKPLARFSFDDEFPGSDSHRISVALIEGTPVWLQLSPQSKNVIFHNDCNALLVINRKLFLEAIRKNSSLFQYVLGPKVTPKKLLQALTTQGNSFDAVFKKDKVLEKILLGYGTTNAIQQGRIEKIQDKQDPSFGFKTSMEEYDTLNNEMEIASPALRNKTPNFTFNCLPKQPATKNLLKKLEKTQAKVNKLLESPTLLSDTLELITGQKYAVDQPGILNLELSEQEKQQINLITAKEIWWKVRDHSKEGLKAFMLGFDHPQDRTSDGDTFFLQRKQGTAFRLHLEGSNQINLDEIRKHLNQMDGNAVPHSELSDGEQHAINKVHWNIYFGREAQI